MTTYDRMRAAAAMFDDCIEDAVCNPPTLEYMARLRDQLRADADRLEAVEREMRSDNPSYTVWAISNGQADEWADRIRGEGK